jgi:hypothetical protein
MVIETVKEVVKEVPVFVDPAKYTEAARNLKEAWTTLVQCEQDCIDKGMQVQYKSLEQYEERGYGGSYKSHRYLPRRASQFEAVVQQHEDFP